MSITNPEPADLLGSKKTANYEPAPLYFGPTFTTLRRLPPFSLSYIRDMLYDPHIIFGLWLIKGPILAKKKFEIQAERDEVAEFVNETHDRFWAGQGASQSLNDIEYGYACNEVMYEVVKGNVQYKELSPILPVDASPCTLKGEFAGALVKHVKGYGQEMFLGGAKCFWPTHNSDFNKHYGRSRLLGAFPPWIEKWHEGGFRDIRKNFYYKFAYQGGVMEYPPGSTPVSANSADSPPIMVPNQDIARDIVNAVRTGGNVTLPYQPTASGENAWRYTPGGASMGDAGSLMEYGKDLDDEIWEGIGVPAEVIQADGSGAYGGRVVPQEAFYATLHMILCELTGQFVKQIVHPLVVMNFGRKNSEFKVRPYGLMEDVNESSDMTQGDVDQNGDPVDPSQDDQPQPGQSITQRKTNGPKRPDSTRPKGGSTTMSTMYADQVEQGRRLRNYSITGGGDIRYGE